MGQFNTIPPNPFPPSSEKVGDAVEIEKDIASIKEDITSLESGLTNCVTKTNFADVFNLALQANGSDEHALTNLEPFRSYIVLAIGQYNPLWSYIGVLHIIENGNATLIDLRASANMLTATITNNKLVFTNENAENSQVINVSIIGYNVH